MFNRKKWRKRNKQEEAFTSGDKHVHSIQPLCLKDDMFIFIPTVSEPIAARFYSKCRWKQAGFYILLKLEVSEQ